MNKTELRQITKSNLQKIRDAGFNPTAIGYDGKYQAFVFKTRQEAYEAYGTLEARYQPKVVANWYWEDVVEKLNIKPILWLVERTTEKTTK